jgi:hypothetical protein
MNSRKNPERSAEATREYDALITREPAARST